MSTALQADFVSRDEYLASEEESSIRREYVSGVVYAMAGGTQRHNLICGALHNAVYSHLRGGACRVFIHDIKVRIPLAPGNDAFYYPDLIVDCGARAADQELFSESPKVIVEVLSESTARVDRIEKLNNYKKIPSLEEYVLVAQDKMEAIVFRRAQNWAAERVQKPDEKLELKSIRFAVSLAEVYRDVSFG